MTILPSNLAIDAATLVKNNSSIQFIRSLTLNRSVPAQISSKGANYPLTLELTPRLSILLPNDIPLAFDHNPSGVMLTLLQKHPETIFSLDPIPNKPSQDSSSDQNSTLLLSLMRLSNSSFQLRQLTPEQKASPVIRHLIETNPHLSTTENIKNLIENMARLSPITTHASTFPQALIERLWPQHARLGSMPLGKIVAALAQLSTQLPLQKLPVEFGVIRHWLNNLLKDINSRSLQSSTNGRPPLTADLVEVEIRNSIAQSGTRFENILRQITLKESARHPLQQQLDADIKAQIIKILQAIPVLIDKYSNQQQLQPQLTDNELWQVMFKVQKLLETMHALPPHPIAEPAQPWTNWVEQTFKLLTLWLKAIEFHQFQQMNPQSHQQALLRFDIPVPLQQGKQWVNINLQQNNKQTRTSKKWLWQLTLKFNFGEDKYLKATTRVSKKKLNIIFEGSDYFAAKMNTGKMQILESDLAEKTQLKTLVQFQLNETGKPLNCADGIHIKV